MKKTYKPYIYISSILYMHGYSRVISLNKIILEIVKIYPTVRIERENIDQPFTRMRMIFRNLINFSQK